MPSFRLQHLQWAGALAVAACCLVLGGAALRSSYRDYAAYDVGARELTRLQTVMAAAAGVASERGPANLAMTTLDAQKEAADEALAARRASVDGAIAAAERQLEPSGPAAAALATLRLRLAEGRATVDAVARLPEAERTAARVLPAIDAMFAAADAAEAARDEIGRIVILRAPQISAEIYLGMSASGLRDHAGRLGSNVVALLVAQAGQDGERYDRLMQTAGRLAQFRRELLNFGQPYFSGGAVGEAIDEVERRYFAKAMPQAIDIARGERWADGVTAAEFARAYGPSLQPVEALRAAVEQALGRTVAELRDAARFRMIASGGLTAVVCLILLALALGFRRALFAPLLTVRDQVAAVAAGDLSDPRAGSPASREVREMFEGLAVLRTELRQKRTLEREQRTLTERLKALSETDMLTGLLNRRAIEERAAEVLAAADRDGGSVAVLLFDVDKFKSINDTFGHSVGDAVLRRMALALSAALGPGDALARFGGEEFVVLAPNVTAREAVDMAERLRETVARLAFPEAAELAVTGSFGVALRAPGSGLGWETLVAVADRRLYAAKTGGRNRVVGGDEGCMRLASGGGSEAAA